MRIVDVRWLFVSVSNCDNIRFLLRQRMAKKICKIIAEYFYVMLVKGKKDICDGELVLICRSRTSIKCHFFEYRKWYPES